MCGGWDGWQDLLAVRLGSPPLDNFLACYLNVLGLTRSSSCSVEVSEVVDGASPEKFVFAVGLFLTVDSVERDAGTSSSHNSIEQWFLNCAPAKSWTGVCPTPKWIN